MRSRFVDMTKGVNFSVVRNAIIALEVFRHYFTMSKADNLA